VLCTEPELGPELGTEHELQLWPEPDLGPDPEPKLWLELWSEPEPEL
jgi:hypothetical protein